MAHNIYLHQTIDIIEAFSGNVRSISIDDAAISPLTSEFDAFFKHSEIPQ